MKRCRSIEERFWAKVDVRGPDDCWLWKAFVNPGGYGRFRFNSRQVGAHVVSWILNRGPVPNGAQVLHNCDVRYSVGDITNRRCVNPAHLKLGDALQNVSDRHTRGRDARGDRNGARVHPETRARHFGDSNGVRLHPESICRGSRHGMAKLSEEDVAALREQAKAGESRPMLCSRFNLSPAQVSRIITGKRWSHIRRDQGGAA